MKRFAILLFFLLASIHLDAQDTCAYISKDSKEGMIEFYEDCATYKEDTLTIKPEYFKDLKFDAYGIANIYVDGEQFYIKKDGSYLHVIVYDNWADDFVEGLVRVRIDGKIAYFDRDFKQVIPADYEWGWQFEEGRALVCKGCTFKREGEHTAVVGGLWGYIDKEGTEVVPIKYTREEIFNR